MQKRLLIVLAFCNIFISFTNAQSIECSLDETTFSGTITTTGAGGVKIKASDATSNYRFGERVAIDGNIAVTVSRNNGAAAGKVYVYINDGSGNWSQQTILTASDGFAGDNFGSSVALEGNYLVVGARSQTNTSVVDSGAAYLFEYDGVSTWTEVKIFEPSDGSSGDRFGESVSIEGNLILVGARDGAVGGCAYLYENDGTNTFTYTETKLEPQVQSNYSGAKFGYDVLIKDGRAYVGGPADYSSVGRASAGSLQIWDQANDGSWSRTHRLRGTETSEYFGSAISVNGNYLAIGAYNFEVSSTPEADQGRVFVYKADVNGDYLDANRVMVQNDDKDSYNDQRFGTDVVIDNGFLYVGTFGNGSNSTDAVYIFKDDSTNNWSQLTKLTSGGGWDEFSNRALAVSYPYLLIGQNEDDSPSNSGAIHFVSLASTITPTASISEVTTAFIGQNNATIKLNFTDEATRTEIQFSIDGGTTYPYVFNDDALTSEITNLGIGSYDLKAKYNSGSCVLDLGTVSVNQAPYTAIPDANFEAALGVLGYDDIAGDGQVPTELIEVVTTLDLSNQNIIDLTGINDFIALESLKLQYNSLTSLDVSSLVNLKTLWASNGNIFNTIDVSNNTALQDFRIRQYKGTTIDLSANTALTRFACTSCDLETVDTSNNPNLNFLDLWDSDITSIDVSSNINLATLDVAYTNLSELDLSLNTGLTNLIAHDINSLTSLNVKNGTNTSITGFKTAGTPVPCILVDDATYSTTNWTNIDATSTFSNTYCNYTAIPDANFEAELEALGYDDISGDGQVPTELIQVVTVLDVSNQNISDLTGIQDFTALTDLNCEINTLTTLDVSNNTNLQKIVFDENNITTINFGANTNLNSIEGRYNQLSSIDITQNTGLTFINIRNNLFSSIDVSNNTLLETINIRECTNVTSIDVSSNTNLKFLYLQDVGLTDIDISQNTLLEVITLERNNLSAIDVSYNTVLRQLRVSDNNITRLDASNNSALTRLSCQNNQLTFLNVQNGNNTAIANGDFNATGNTDLKCIKVDDTVWSTTNWTDIDSEVMFYSTGVCRYTTISDSNFEAALENLGYDDISGDGQVPTQNIETVTDLDLRSEAISDLTGIEDFIALKSLNLKNNSLTSINLTNNTDLETLGVSENDLTSIDLSKNLKLTTLDIGANPITSIDVSNNTSLTRLECPVTDITSIDVSNLTQLTFLELFQTDITTLDVSNNLVLRNLILYRTNLTSLDISLNTELTQLRIDYTAITSIDLSTNTKLTEVRVNGSDITRLDLINQIALTQFYGQTGVLEYINIKNGNNVNITNFDVRNNSDLTCVTVDDAIYSTTNWTDISSSTNFTEGIYCDYTDIPDANFEARLEALGHDDISGDGKVPTRLIQEVTSLTVNGNSVSDFTGIEDFTGLTYLDVGNNNITNLDVSDITLLTFLRVDGNSLTNLDLSKNTLLVDLRCSYNSGITGLDLSSNTLLETAHLGNNSIASLDVSNNSLLYDLRLTGNNLTTLSVTNNTALQTLIVSNNPITTLDLATNTTLTSLYGTNCGLTTVTNINSTVLQDLYLQRNNLTGIDFSSSAATITNVYLSENSITDLDFTGAISLKKLSVYENNISSLDVTQAVSLEEVYVTDNDLTYFNIKNGNNTAIHEFHADNNPSLTCILVDDASTSTTRWMSGIDNTASFSDTYCRYTAIPDSIFEARLESLGYDDISGDGQVPTALIETVTSLTVNDLGINELTGIENFTALVTLNARGNNFTTLDVSENVLLQHLYINSNSLPSIDVSKNVVLRNLNIGSNSITSLDVSNNPDLRDLWVQGNGGLTTLDLSNNLEIRELYTYSSGVSTLDLSIHVELRILSAYRTSMTSIDLSNNPELRSLRVDETNISTLDLTNNTKIETLRVNDTGITRLDLSNQTNLEKLWAHDTSLSNLNVRNGNNTNVTTFEIENNPNLTCVLVDDATYSTTNWANKDATTNFSDTYCEYTSIPDANFEAALEALGYDDISGDGQVPTPLIEVVEDLAIVSKSIADITGIEDFIALKTLNCAGNTFTSLDLSNNTQLTSVITKFTPLTTLNISNSTNLDVLVCSFNNLTTLDVSNNIALTYLECNNNNLTNLGVSLNTALLDLRCGNNSLTAIDVSTNTALTSFWCQDNSITDLDLSNQTGLVSITVNNNSLTSLNVKNGNNTNVTNFIATGNPSLTCITVDDAAYSTTNWLGVDDTASFNNLGCRYTQIPDANFEAELEALGYDDISGDGQVPTYLIEGVTTLNVNNLSITDFTGIEDFVGLTHLDVGNNNAGSIDITSLVLLEFVRLDAMSLTSIDLSKNIALTDLRCSFNTGITSIDISNNTLLETAHIGNNSLTSINLSNNTLLYELRMSHNNLTSVDLSNNTALIELNLSNNELSSLNLKNANNTNIVLISITGNPLLSCVLVDDATYSTTNWTNIDNTTSFSDTSCLGVQIALKVYLQGAFLNPNSGEESLMRDDLRVSGGIYGATSPYSDSATISDAIKMDDVGADSMVDWVWVELRDAENPSQVIAGKSGILQRDGDVVAITDDRNSPMSFNVSADNYYIVIKHRNHLNIMTAAVINLSKTITTVDLSSTNTAVAGGVNGVVDMGSGIFAMISGDFDENGQIQNIDTNSVIQQLGVSGYNKADFDMNGQVQNSDINNLLNPNIGRGEQLLK